MTRLISRNTLLCSRFRAGIILLAHLLGLPIFWGHTVLYAFPATDIVAAVFSFTDSFSLFSLKYG